MLSKLFQMFNREDQKRFHHIFFRSPTGQTQKHRHVKTSNHPEVEQFGNFQFTEMSMKSSLVDFHAILRGISQVRLFIGTDLALVWREDINGYHRTSGSRKERLQLSLHVDNNDTTCTGGKECWVMRTHLGWFIY